MARSWFDRLLSSIADRGRAWVKIPTDLPPQGQVRALAQSLARELGPKGLHVAHVVIDGMIDGVFARGIAPDAAERLAREEILDPEEIARNYVWLHSQRRSAWTFELDLRPWSEKW